MVGCDWMELKFQNATDSLTSIPKEDPCWIERFCDSDSGKDVNKLIVTQGPLLDTLIRPWLLK